MLPVLQVLFIAVFGRELQFLSYAFARGEALCCVQPLQYR